ncbi:DUF6483 family protein [Clostridium akagii]|uniref:DUF6483 family protein n=1 Tax=Clostridium akagii TaxID=91623 RepID=UPI000479D2AA|nr:DUF6483 family protein [Clostridium akagii]
MTDDYIIRLTESIGQALAKIIFNKQQNEFENISIESMTGKDILPILLKRFVLQGKYNEAENILFEEIDKNPCNDLVNIGMNFYNGLLEKNDEELAKGNFSREEIYQGIEEIENIK